MKRKFAIVYFGLLRSLGKVYKSHYKNLFEVLKRHNVDYDIFIHSWKTINNKQQIWGKFIEEEQDYSLNKLLNPYQFKLDDQNEFDENIDFNKYFYEQIYKSMGNHKDGEWEPYLIKNHLRALESLKRGFKLVIDSKNKYDYVLFLRPDILITCRYPILSALNLLNRIENIILLPRTISCWEGYNDRSAAMNYNYAKYYANRIDEIVDFRKKHGRIVSEKFTKYIVDKYYFRKDYGFIFEIIRP